MDALFRLGRIAFALGITGLGVLGLVFGAFLDGIQPAPADFPGREAVIYLNAGLFAVCGAALLWDRTAKLAAMALGALFLAWLGLGHAPALFAAPDDPAVRVSASQVLALSAVSWMLATLLTPGDQLAGRAAWIGRACFAIMLIVFGVTHLMYHRFIATMVPEWMPGREFWPYVTGVAQLAAAAALLINVRARLAAMLVGAMYAAWILLVHSQRLVSTPGDHHELIFATMALVLVGAAWIVASGMKRPAKA